MTTVDEHRIVVGLDYGTTFSGVGYGNTSQKDIHHINVIRNWPGKQNEVKCPSDIAYQNNSYRWGYEIPANQPKLSWAKLDLDEDNFYDKTDPDFDDPFVDVSNEDEFALAEGLRHNPLNKSPVDIVADYLTSLYNHIMTSLVDSHSQQFIDITAIDWVMTVPAVWSEKAQALTKEAASRAGIGQRSRDRLFLLSEPEAAAVYAISELVKNYKLKSSTTDNLKVGDTFVLCDAGGGTVDLISYKIHQMTPTLILTEAAVGSGAKCGSTFVDRGFLKLLRKKLGDARFTKLCTKQKGAALNRVIADFVTLKKNFGSTTSDGIGYVPLPGFPDDPKAGIEDGDLQITDEDLQQCFDPIVDQIIDLVQGQVDALDDQGTNVKYVFLVGGFGESKYLLNRLRDHDFDATGKLEIINPYDSWSAVSRGAVLRGLEGSLVSSRKCRRNYGTRINTVFDPTRHRDEDAFYSTDTGLKMARNQVSWIVEKGAPTDSNTSFSLKCGTTFQKGEKLRRGATLVASDLDLAPDSYRDKSVHDLCFLMADLSTVPDSEFDEVNIGGQAYLAAEFTIEMVFESAEIKFQLKYKDKSYGEVKTTFH